MWSAIKSDLFEFVSTVQTDTTSTISKVIRESEQEKVGTMFRRSQPGLYSK
jgi:hypothetical protein